MMAETATEVEVSEEKPREERERIKFTPSFLKSPVGFIMLFNSGILLVAWITAAATRDHLNWSTGSVNSFVWLTVVSWLFWTVVLGLCLFNVLPRLTFINWPLTLLVNCVIDAIVLLVTSALLADSGRQYHAGGYSAAGAMGFFAMIGLSIQAYFHFMMFRETR